MLLLAREPKNEVINIKQVHRLTIKHLYTNCKQVRLNIGLGKGYMPSCSHKNNPQTGEPQTANPSRNKVSGEGTANPYRLRSSNTWMKTLILRETWKEKKKKKTKCWCLNAISSHFQSNSTYVQWQLQGNI